MLNPNLDIEQLKADYQSDHRLRIDNFLLPEKAQEIVDCLQSELQFHRIFFNDGNNYVVSTEQWNSIEAAARQKIQAEIAELASRGIGFLYEAYRMDKDNWQKAPKVLRELFEFINGGDVLDLVSSISGIRDIHGASGQYTRYNPGHYLTRHFDDVSSEGRLLAYVLNFTQKWHPDWGGLLQFYEGSGVPRDAWEPRFNSISLFDVRHIHAVTYVAPYAKAPRFALTGWFNSDVN